MNTELTVSNAPMTTHALLPSNLHFDFWLWRLLVGCHLTMDDRHLPGFQVGANNNDDILHPFY